MTSELIRQIRDYVPKFIRDEFARDMFMLSFYLVGTNSVDLFNCKDLKHGRLIYERTKTKSRRSDRAEIQINIEPEAVPLFEKYKDKSGTHVFDFHTRYTDSEGFNAAINKGLKYIGTAIGIDNLQFYAARHSWATIALNECDIPKSDVHEFLNHVDTELRVTELYTQKDWGRLARANRKVLDRLKI
jgi:integrase